MANQLGVGQAGREEPSTPTATPTWVARSKYVQDLLLPYSVHQQKAGSKLEELGHKQAPTWHDSVAGGSSTCYAITPGHEHLLTDLFTI